MIKQLPTVEQIYIARQENLWDFGNDVLYRLCKDNFKHDMDDQILTKVLFINRIYAAAVERRRKKTNNSGDKFYTHTVVPAFKNSELDNKLFDLNVVEPSNVEDIKIVLQTHYFLTTMLEEITALNKRSFSSKYLHFHIPNLFFIELTNRQLDNLLLEVFNNQSQFN